MLIIKFNYCITNTVFEIVIIISTSLNFNALTLIHKEQLKLPAQIDPLLKGQFNELILIMLLNLNIFRILFSVSCIYGKFSNN